MKLARNSLKGYTYQNYIFTLLLAKMDTEREIVKIISEATDTKNFDDAYVELSSGTKYRLQVKNYEGVQLDDIKVDSIAQSVSIKGNQNVYDPSDNNIFIINTDLNIFPDTVFLGIPALKLKNIIIVPISSGTVADLIESLYQKESRALQIIQYGYIYTTSGKFEVDVKDLPPIISISTQLNNETVFIRGVPDEIPFGVNHIEGKPGVGKSHYVNEIIDSYPDSIIYRFWIGSQDVELNTRLQFEMFIEQIGLLSFQSPRAFTVEELIEQLCQINKVLIIDGLDHVENYNPNELNRYIDFLDNLNDKNIRIILLSRPMRATLSWKKTVLLDWTYDETALYLATAYSITDYSIQGEIYSVSKGYPIITYYLAEHYLKYGKLNIDNPIESINEYYNKLIADVRTKSLLGVFACNNSFFTNKEINELFDSGLYDVIKEFIDGYPYLFEIQANRISLVHDSFNTFLRQQIDLNEWVEKINKEVCSKLLSGDVEYMARLSSFHLKESFICEILKMYSDFDVFDKLIRSTVDFNSVSSFYQQLRKMLELRPNVLDIYQYYSFSLIFQIVIRNDLIGYEDLIFQILMYLNNNSDIENHIFSSDIIWQIYLEFREHNGYLKRYLNNSLYGDEQLDYSYDSINEEMHFYDCLDSNIDVIKMLEQIDLIQMDNIKKSKLLQEYLVKMWIQQNSQSPFFSEFNDYIENGSEDGIAFAIQTTYQLDKFDTVHVYNSAKYRLHELGFFSENNIFRNKTIFQIIKERACDGSFDVAPEVLSFLRLANFENRTVDINNINYIWGMYFQRKDYSVHTIDTALVTFENYGLIEASDSIDIICRLMRQSEKGIRHLLASYIDLKGPEFVKILTESDKIMTLNSQLDYFELCPENINCLPKEAIKIRLNEVMRYYSRLDYIEGRDIGNVLKSEYKKMICDALDFYDKKVMEGLDDEEIEILKEAGIEYICNPDANVEREYIPFRNGYIDREDFDYIRDNSLSIMECSRYADGWYTCLPFVDLYELFDIEEVREQYLSIIHQALFAKVNKGEHIGNWNDIVGNIPDFINKYEVHVDWKRLFYIFLRFMDCSFIYYPEKLRNNSYEFLLSNTIEEDR